MTSSFCPGHVSCVFQPITSFDAMCSGSRGIGIRLNKGATATVEKRDDGVVNIFLDGSQSVACVDPSSQTVHLVRVQTGIESDLEAEIFPEEEELREGAEIIISPSGLEEGMPVTVKKGGEQ